MIPRLRGAAPLSLLCATAVHAAVLVWVGLDRRPVEMEGGGAGTSVALGSSFADMTAGPQQSEAPARVVESRTPKEAASGPPADHAAPIAPQVQRPEVQSDQSVPSAPIEMLRGAPTGQTTAVPVATAHPTAEPAMTAATSAQGAETAIKVEPQNVTTATTPRTLTEAYQDDAPAPAASVRPAQRSAAFEARHKPPEPAEPQTTRETRRGNADRNTRTGSVDGTETAMAASSGSRIAVQRGNAAASNYPGLVMRKLSRVPRPDVSVRGQTIVAFSIASNGGLLGVSVARSSGSAAIDGAATRVVQKAAPFPAPPSGARRSFTVTIKGR